MLKRFDIINNKKENNMTFTPNGMTDYNRDGAYNGYVLAFVEGSHGDRDGKAAGYQAAADDSLTRMI